MLKLHGFAVSNYFNMVRMALMEKGAHFEIIEVYPGQDAAHLARSPVGKVPCLETEYGFLSETSVILDYIEDVVPQPPFYPADPFQRARVRQAMKMMELYVELPARRLYPGVFFGGKNTETTIAEVEPVLRKGMAGLGRVLKCSPFVMGAQMTYADFFAAYTFSLAGNVARKVYGWDIVAEVPGLGETLAALAGRDSAKAINADMKTSMAAFQAHMAKQRGG
jgi:glutathione S-transferase